ncbi:aminotransferase class V-fold PLP-dependent enzyme [Jejudonia soesokkakensis]|uniref:Aminotransferase class V-fold PLP-dependent enzyme n=1 Tax=Jejudonia soesokkakensis TaxID=1323432 RepID=A0ABW2MVL3_9FLAO
MRSQKHLFSLPEEITYLNCATMSAQLKSVEKIGIENLLKKSTPYVIEGKHFFEERAILKQRFAQLIDCTDDESVSIIPSVSYGIANAVKNIPFEKGDEIIVLDEQFPSNFYAWKHLETTEGVSLKTVAAPPVASGRGSLWNEKLLNTINSKTKVVSIPQVHWADGTLFNLKAIREKTNEVGAYLIIDGTQSVGAMEFSIQKIQPDALICAGYKWLMGGYGLGMAYYGARFYDGTPIENNWMNHEGSEDFTHLAKYNENFKPKSARYDMGESSNFILTPMLSEGIRQLNEWSPKAIQEYCKIISQAPIQQLKKLGYFIEEESFRANHLFGIYLSEEKKLQSIKDRLQAEKIFVSYRGNAIRVSPNVYNTEADLMKLVECFF